MSALGAPKPRSPVGPASPGRRARPSAAYDEDFFAWTREQARLLREGAGEGLDRANLAEEVEDLGSSQRDEIGSRMIVLVQHLLKWGAQPERRSNSWRASIGEARNRIGRLLRKSPSLRRAPAEEFGPEDYQVARGYASGDTGLPLDRFPEAMPFTVEQALDPAFLPGPAEPTPR